MIDWVSAVLPCSHDSSALMDGFVMSFDAKGEQQWIVNKKLTVEGSYSSKIQIKSHTDNQIYISGNPAKFLQGHNLFGTDDLSYLMGRFFDALLDHDIGLSPSDSQYEAIQAGDYALTRVDPTQTWHLNNKNEVAAWIRALGQKARLKHRGPGQFSGDTAYFGKNSRRWGVKCYSKGHEILAKGHQLPKELQLPEMLDFADKSLRIELVIRQLELKRLGLDIASNWKSDTAKMLLQTMFLDNLELSDNVMLDTTVLDTLPPRLRLVYQSWIAGDDLKQVLPRPTFYRYRKQLLEYGIDISIVQTENRSNVVPLVRYLEAQPVGIPNWAYAKRLVA